MKRPLHLILGALLSTQLLACQNTPNLTGDMGQLPNQSGITPEPKGPKPTDGITLPPMFSTPTSQRQGLDGNASAVAEMSQPMIGGPGAGDNLVYDSAAPEEPIAPMPAHQATPSPTPATEVAPPEQSQKFFYFSYDDSASTAGVEQTHYALENGILPRPAWVRPWEFLSAERFERRNQVAVGPFSVSMGLWQHGLPGQDATAYDLGVHIHAPEITQAERRPLVLTLVLDISGSMNNASGLSHEGTSLMQVAQAGLRALPAQLKTGDVLNLVTFSNQAQVVLENWTYQGNAAAYLEKVESLQAQGGTHLEAGINEAYRLAQAQFKPEAINRVVMMTDAFANQGQVDPSLIAKSTRIHDQEGIYFSGLGFGFDFNEAFLNELTEAGQGTYFSVISTADAERSFGERFMSLVNIAARNVRFRLDYPASLQHTQSASEESSQVASEVQPIHFSYNTSQYFLERFRTDGETVPEGRFKLTIAYTDPVSNKASEAVLDLSLDEIRNQDLSNIKDARVVTLLTSLIRGELSATEARAELDTLLSNHSTALANRYKTYIETWLRLSGQNP